MIDAELDHDEKTEPGTGELLFVHSHAELFDGHAASFRDWFAGLDWLSEMVPDAHLDGHGHIFDSEGLHVGNYVDRFDRDGAIVDY